MSGAPPPASLSRFACLDDNEIVLLLEGKLSERARAGAEAHLDGCEACRYLIGAASPTAPVRDERDERVLYRGASLGRYLVLSLLGRGGMGRVYAAYDPELGRHVALKLLHTARGPEGARRLLAREARALGKLSHPNVVQVYDVGEHEGDVFVAMEMVEGRSLDAWCQGPPRPAWREVLAAYLDAAEGLSAAHAKGLVHRDVKPSNILRGDDGRVRVADFGLAAAREIEAHEGGAPASSHGASALGETLPAPAGPRDDGLTAAGGLVGTPLYMAPEQQEGSGTSARSDQYSLCVALHEGLYGRLPFALGPEPTSLAALLVAKKAGAPSAPPAGTGVPAWVYQALSRGLAPAPADRYPSMDALIAALRADPEARRRARLLRAGIGGAAAVLIAVAAAGWAESGAFHDPCKHPEQQLAGAWDEGVRGRVRAAFLGTGRPYAEGTVTRVLGLLDGYAAEWGAMRGEVCAASRGDPRRREVLDLRDACLDRRRAQLQALTTLFAERPDAQVLEKAVPAAAGLPPLAYCADIEALTARVRPPEDPALRARVASLQPQVDRVEALFTAGRFKEALALGEPLLAEIEGVDYPPLRAQLQVSMGRVRERTGDYEAAKTLTREGAISASEARDDVLAATAWARLLFITGDRQRHLDEAALIRALGPTVLVRVQDERARSAWLNTEGLILYRMGRFADARTSLERALGLREKVLPPDHPDIGTSLSNLGLVLYDMGAYREALAVQRRGLGLRERALGPDHPDTAVSLNNLGIGLQQTGGYPESVACYQRALAIEEATLGPDHPDVAMGHSNLGQVLFLMGEHARAVENHERALAISEKAMGPEHPAIAYILAGLGRARVPLGRFDEAQAALDRARALREKDQGAMLPALAEPLIGLGELALARGRPVEAAALLERALALDNLELRREIQIDLAEALWLLGKDRPRARALVEEARAAYERAGNRSGQDRAGEWLARHPG